MSENPKVTQYAIDEAKRQAWLNKIRHVTTQRHTAIKNELDTLLDREGGFVAFNQRRLALIGDEHGQGLGWKPAFTGFWAVVNFLFSWLFGRHEPGSALYHALTEQPPHTLPEPAEPPQSIRDLLARRRFFTPADFHTHLKSFAQSAPEAFVAALTPEEKPPYLERDDYGFLCLDVLTGEILKKLVLPGGNQVFALQELLLVLAENPKEIPGTFDQVTTRVNSIRLTQRATIHTSNLNVLRTRLGNTSIHPPLLEHVARRGVEMLLLQLSMNEDQKNENLHPRSSFRDTITCLCTNILSIKNPKFEERNFAELTKPSAPTTHFGEYKSPSHGAFAISLGFVRGGAEGALWTFMDAVNREVIKTEQQRAYVLERFSEIASRQLIAGTFKKVRDFIAHYPLAKMTGSTEEIQAQINSSIGEALSLRAASSVNDAVSVATLCQCKSSSFCSNPPLQPGTPTQGALTPAGPETPAPETGCPSSAGPGALG